MKIKLELNTFLNLPNCLWQTYMESYFLGSYYLIDKENYMYGMVRYSEFENNYVPLYLSAKCNKIHKSSFFQTKYISLSK